MKPVSPRASTILAIWTAVSITVPGAPAVGAGRVPVSYQVERAPFVQGVSAGDSLRFQMCGDGACATVLHTEELVVGTPGLLVERVDLEPAGQQPPGGTGALRLGATVSAPSIDGPLFLRVAGSGIQPSRAQAS